MEEPIFDSDYYNRLNTLQLSTHIRMSQGMSGGRKSNAKGSSVEFSDYREYILGDDLRRIDWGAYGRLDKLYIKQYMEEKEGMFHIFIDTSRSMEFGEVKKSRLALQLAGALSYIILNNLDRVYVTQMRENTLIQGKGRTGRNAYQAIIKELQDITFDGNTKLNDAILSRPMQTHGVSIIISDFLDTQGIEDAIQYLTYKKQQIVLLQVLAREELEIQGEGNVNLVDMETGEELRLTMNRTSVEQYQTAMKKWQEQIAKLAAKYQMIYVKATSDEPVDRVLFDTLMHQGFITHK